MTSAWLQDVNRITLPNGRRVVGGSFRGVPFLIESSDRSGGRRVIVHDFPQRDAPFIDELGRTSPTIRVEAFVLGDDVAKQRDNLRAALEDVAGPGVLVHPEYGRLDAVCVSLTIRQSNTEGRIARFQIDFQIQPDEPVAPIETPDLESEVEERANAATTASTTALTDGYDATGAPGYAVASLEAELTARTEAARDALGRIATTTAELARLELEVNSLVGDVTTLIRSPADALAAFLTVLTSLGDTIASAPGRVVDAYLETYDLADQPAVIGTSAINLAEAANLAALTAALKQGLLIAAARLLPSVEYETTDDARLGVRALTERLDAQALTATDDVYQTLADLRATVTQAVPGDAVLARIITVENVLADPSLLVTYRLYGSVAREQDVVERNAAPDPGFLSGDIEALSQ